MVYCGAACKAQCICRCGIQYSELLISSSEHVLLYNASYIGYSEITIHYGFPL